MNIAFIDVFRAALRSMNYNYTLIQPPFENLERFDYGLRQAVTETFDFRDFGRQLLERMPEDTLVMTEDELGCRYGMLKLPDQPDAVHMMGPLIHWQLPAVVCKQVQDQFGDKALESLQRYYRSIPMAEGVDQLGMLGEIYDAAYPGRHLQWRQIRGFLPMPLYTPKLQASATADLNRIDADLLQEQYLLEERIMTAVSMGDSEMAAMQMAGMDRFRLREFSTSPLRNIKNHAMGINAQCKLTVAKTHSVHPVYVERLYEAYAIRIEHLSSLSDMRHVVGQMVADYCNCVKIHSLAQYSPQVQRVINYIYFHLAENMSLKFFAQMCNISSSYLSNLFRVETGMTLTEYINRCRVDRAAVWLRLSDDPIAKIGERVGFLDENYFTRVFKRIKGVPPSVYRRSASGPPEDRGIMEELHIRRIREIKEDQP